MIKEALQYIIDIQNKRIERVNGKDYYFRGETPVLLGECHSCDALEISTLTSLVDYIKRSMADDFAAVGGVPKMIVHVKSETEVDLISVFNNDMDRWKIASVKAMIPKITLGRFMDQEQFIIQMQSMFIDTPDKKVVMQVAGNVEDRTVANYGDDGVSQKATIKTGLANKEDVIVPNPVKLCPFRTFHEALQPETNFVFRMKNEPGGVSCALFEADGGAWKFEAVHSIAEYLTAELEGMENIVILS